MVELTKQEVEIVLALFEVERELGDLTSAENDLMERLQVELVTENTKERERVELTVTRNALGWTTVWIQVDGTLECGGSFIPANSTLFGETNDRFSMSVWNGQRWVTSDTLGGD